MSINTDNTMQHVIEELRRPFPAEIVKFRSGGAAGVMAYIDARDAADRLNRVAPGWSSAFAPSAVGKGVECQITIDGVTRADVGFSEGTDEMAIKACYSDAFKRAAVMWGVAASVYSYRAPRWSGPLDGDAIRKMREHYAAWIAKPEQVERFGRAFGAEPVIEIPPANEPAAEYVAEGDIPTVAQLRGRVARAIKDGAITKADVAQIVSNAGGDIDEPGEWSAMVREHLAEELDMYLSGRIGEPVG